jgi:hypothetical protein
MSDDLGPVDEAPEELPPVHDRQEKQPAKTGSRVNARTRAAYAS